MDTNKLVKDPLELHHEMYERRRQQAMLYGSRKTGVEQDRTREKKVPKDKDKVKRPA